MQQVTNFSIASKGFATSFPESDIPKAYSIQFRNLFTNTVGNCEKRQGIEQFEELIDSHIPVANLHELVINNDTFVFATGEGQVQKLDETTGLWTLVFTFPTTTEKIFSMSQGSKLVFTNGVDRNVYTEDGETFYELLSVLEAGIATSVCGAATTDETHLANLSTVPNWTVTDVAQYSVVYYPRVSAYAAVIAVASASLTTTPVSALGLGIGAGTVPTSGSPYTIIDTLALNIIPVSGAQINELDNEGILASGSNTSTIRFDTVSDFTITEARKDDFVVNVTRNAITKVIDVTTSSLSVTPITGQTVGDSMVLLKSSMPICKQGVVHFQRAYMIDSRDTKKVRISGPTNIQDFGSSLAATLDVGSLQSESQNFLGLLSWQRFLVIGGTKNVYFFEGTDPSPTSDANPNPVDFSQIGMFPVGILSRTGMVNIGNDVFFATINGIRRATLSKSTAQIIDASVSFQIDKTLRELLKNLSQDDIVLFHYPKRSWVGVKAGSELYIFNYIAAQPFGGNSSDQYAQVGAWHLFDGGFANQNCFLVRQDGTLLTGGRNGTVSIFDQNVYSDLGQPIKTVYQTGWLTMENSNRTITRKQGKSIKPVFQAGSNIDVTVNVDAPFTRRSKDTTTITTVSTGQVIGSAIVGTAVIGGNNITNTKMPLRWEGEQARFTFSTENVSGPLVLSNFTVLWLPGGIE